MTHAEARRRLERQRIKTDYLVVAHDGHGREWRSDAATIAQAERVAWAGRFALSRPVGELGARFEGVVEVLRAGGYKYLGSMVEAVANDRDAVRWFPRQKEAPLAGQRVKIVGTVCGHVSARGFVETTLAAVWVPGADAPALTL